MNTVALPDRVVNYAALPDRVVNYVALPDRAVNNAALPDRAVNTAAKAFILSPFMRLQQQHISVHMRTPPMESRLMYRHSAIMHSHRTPGKAKNKNL